MTMMSFGRFATASNLATVHSVARTHVGLVRVINEDRVFDCPERRVWAVADGMGGHAGGDLAAQAVIDRLRILTSDERVVRFADMLVALGQANGDIRARNERFAAAAGTTVVAAMIDGSTGHIAWAGDSRAYRLRDGALDLLTHDHSVVQELVDAGLLTPDRVERHPQSHVVTRALGVEDDPRLQTTSVHLLPGDRLLLCSDGLSRSLATGDADRDALDQLADRLLANALGRDGSDNVSLILIDYDNS
ncbi:PP2C family protein-serine/threonine phosphatase [Sphingomonas sp. TX0543]|uniref:PP2C family protein-serine/threonine phosphatase n=1 Tax=unclassified Sphingomonas TaxID=196159 RepID=UPI002016897E|nr:protein phosphatase 2C domain-containing protein [Sphingomonas sp. 3P27F8]